MGVSTAEEHDDLDLARREVDAGAFMIFTRPAHNAVLTRVRLHWRCGAPAHIAPIGLLSIRRFIDNNRTRGNGAARLAHRSA